MREIELSELSGFIRELLLRANTRIGNDITAALQAAQTAEESPLAVRVLDMIAQNNQIAEEEHIALCQDTGIAVLFIDIGQDIHFTGGIFEEAVNAGVAAAYLDGYLRKSVVADPVYDRVNTRDNTPAVIHTRIVPGEKVRVLAIAKGFGSENASAVKMLTPLDGENGILDFIEETVRLKGANACPPLIIGVGIGGTFESAAVTAKKMTARPLDQKNTDARYALLEEKALQRVNALSVGPAGFGGKTTALKVNIGFMPTHIAGMPVAVNICCHASRHAEGEL